MLPNVVLSLKGLFEEVIDNDIIRRKGKVYIRYAQIYFSFKILIA